MILKYKSIWRIIYAGLFSLLISCISFSCIDNEFDMKKASPSIVFDPNFAMTIGTINLDLQDFLKKMDSTVLHKAPDGMFYVVFENNFLSYKGEDKIKVAQQVPFILPALIFPLTFPADSVTRDTTFYFPFATENNQILDSVLLKNMALSFNGYSNCLNDGLITITFPTILKGNEPYKIKFRIPKSTSGNNVPVYYSSDPSKVMDYTMTFSKDNSGLNALPLEMSYTLYGSTGAALDISKYLNLTFSIDDMNYKAMYGYLGKYQLLDLTDIINTDFLNQDLAKNVEWKSPKAEIMLINGYGIPIRFEIANMTVYPRNSAFPENVTPSGHSNPYDIHFPSFTQKYAPDTLRLDTLNSRPLFKSLENAPTKINYHITAVCNPDENLVKTNVVYDTSTISGKLKFELPIYFRTSGLEHKDTIDFNMFGGDNNSSIKSMLFRIVSSNELPVDMLLQMEFVDKDNHVVSSLFENVPESERVIIKGGSVDANGNLIKGTEFKKDIVFTDKALEGISKAKKIIYTTRVLTTDYNATNKTGPYVKFKDGLKLKMSFICQLQTQIEL